jgi:methionyl-tRNA formyltransferase
LPNYRGAAPINWAIINGETETGVTTFIDDKIDTGAMILNAITINQEENAGQLHDRLMQLGSETVIKTLTLIEKDKVSLTIQTENPDIKLHIKSIKEIAKSTRSGVAIHNLIRGLSPYPAACAFSRIKMKSGPLKYMSSLLSESHDFELKIITKKGNENSS